MLSSYNGAARSPALRFLHVAGVSVELKCSNCVAESVVCVSRRLETFVVYRILGVSLRFDEDRALPAKNRQREHDRLGPGEG